MRSMIADQFNQDERPSITFSFSVISTAKIESEVLVCYEFRIVDWPYIFTYRFSANAAGTTCI